jgi:hypothetical protein
LSPPGCVPSLEQISVCICSASRSLNACICIAVSLAFVVQSCFASDLEAAWNSEYARHVAGNGRWHRWHAARTAASVSPSKSPICLIHVAFAKKLRPPSNGRSACLFLFILEKVASRPSRYQRSDIPNTHNQINKPNCSRSWYQFHRCEQPEQPSLEAEHSHRNSIRVRLHPSPRNSDTSQSRRTAPALLPVNGHTSMTT